MLSKLSILLVSSAALLGLAIAVRGQDGSPRQNPFWPFARSSNQNSGSDSGNNGQDGSTNSSQQQPQATHSVSAQSDANRRLYGPSLAVRPGVANGYAPANTSPGGMAPRTTSNDMLPVVSQGTVITNPYATDSGNAPQVSQTPPAASPAAAAEPSRSYGPAYAKASSQAAKTDDSTPRDSRSLPDRLAAIRQLSGGDRSISVATDVDESPSAPPVKTSTSSRRVVSSDGDADGSGVVSGPSAAPNKAASIETTHHSDVAAGSDSPKPEALKPQPVLPEAAFAPSSHSPARAAAEIAKTPNNASSAGSVLFSRQSPQVTVETTGPRTIVLGKEANYLVTIKNSGEVGAQDLSVTVKIPEWTDVAGSQASAGTTRVAAADNNEPFQWKLPRLEAHGKETLTLRLLPRKGKSFDLAVQWSFSPLATQTMVEVQEPKLNMTIAGPDEVIFGQSKLYRLTISNPGTGDADNVIVELDPIGNSTAPASKHQIGTIHAGDSKVVELELTARQAGALSIHAAATADPELKAEAAQEVLVRRAAVALAVEGAKAKYAGTLASYSIKVTNPGNANAENVHVFAVLPQGAKFISASSGGQLKAEQGKVVWSLSALRPGSETALELKCTLVAPGPNRLQITSSAAGDVSDVANITTNVEALADLKLEVAEPAGPIGIGDEISYELHVHNRGSKGADGIGVVIYFSAGIEPVSASGGAHDISNGVVAFRPLPNLAAGGDATFKIKARAEHSGKQVFRAEVECGSLGTKLVNAEEMMVYGGDETPGLERADRSLAERNPPLQAVPSHSDEDAAKPLRR